MTKEEKKDEMKNRISMALKDPILQQGFEIICKNLAELENKIADIKANCDLAIEGRDIKIKELEQQIEKMKRCEICKHFRWNCCSYEISITKDCIQNKMKHFELKEIEK